MLLSPVWELFETRVFPHAPQEGLFNPYAERHETFDLPDATAIRRANLRSYLARYEAPPSVLLLAEAPGPWGCRFSGVPLVSEAQLVDAAFPIHGRQSSTAERPYGEYSANIYWRVLEPFFPHFFTWNTVPFHPYKRDRPLSIRNPTNREVTAFADVLRELVGLLQPRRILAVGRKAEYALGRIGVPCTYVRHPSQGGARLFEEGVLAAFEALGLPA